MSPSEKRNRYWKEMKISWNKYMIDTINQKIGHPLEIKAKGENVKRIGYQKRSTTSSKRSEERKNRRKRRGKKRREGI